MWWWEERANFVCSPVPSLGFCPRAWRGEDAPAGRPDLTQHGRAGLHPLPSLPQGHEPIMTILQVFQMERSDFSALILGTALPLLMINPHDLSYARGSEHRHKPVPQLISCIITAHLSGLSTSVPCKGPGTLYPSPSSRPGAVVKITQCLFCLLATELPTEGSSPVFVAALAPCPAWA